MNKTRYGLAADQRVMTPELITQNIEMKNMQKTQKSERICVTS